MSLPPVMPGDVVEYKRTTSEGVVTRRGRVVSLSWVNRPKAEVTLGSTLRVWVEIAKLKKIE